MAAPQYKTARGVLVLTAGLGVGAVILGCIVLAWKMLIGGGFTLYPVAALLIINGIAIVAAAQMGYAVLDTAISTREAADAMKEIARKQAPKSAPDIPVRTSPSLRAER